MGALRHDDLRIEQALAKAGSAARYLLRNARRSVRQYFLGQNDISAKRPDTTAAITPAAVSGPVGAADKAVIAPAKPSKTPAFVSTASKCPSWAARST